jgi:hypothetical protein
MQGCGPAAVIAGALLMFECGFEEFYCCFCVFEFSGACFVAGHFWVEEFEAEELVLADVEQCFHLLGTEGEADVLHVLLYHARSSGHVIDGLD